MKIKKSEKAKKGNETLLNEVNTDQQNLLSRLELQNSVLKRIFEEHLGETESKESKDSETSINLKH
jgi:hypothetical protein